MRLVKIVSLLLTFAWSPCAWAQGDVLERQSAVVREGKTSLPELLAQSQEMIRTEPRNPQSYVLAAALYDRDESKLLFEKALSIAPHDPSARVGLARYLARRGDFHLAWPEFQRALALMPNDKAVRLETIRAAAKASLLEDAKKLAGSNTEQKLEIVQALIDIGQFDEARRTFSDLGFESDNNAATGAVKGRLAYVEGRKKKNQEQTRIGGDLWLLSWRKSPELLSHYKGLDSRESLIHVLTMTGRRQESLPVVRKGIEILPQEFALYEDLWRAELAAAKTDFAPERKGIQTQIETLLKTFPASPELLKAAAAGYRLVDLNAEADRINQRLLAEFPYSTPTRILRMNQAMQGLDPAEKVARIERFNRDFPDSPLYPEYFRGLVARNAPNEDVLRVAEVFIQYAPYSEWGDRQIFYAFAVSEVGEVFTRRKIYLDLVGQWLSQVKITSESAPTSWDLRILALKARLGLLQGRKDEAEKSLRRLLNLETEALSSYLDKAKIRLYLGETVEAQNKNLEEALDFYAQGYAQSMHHVQDAKDKFENLFRRVRGTEEGMKEYLSVREETFQADVKSSRFVPLSKPAPGFEAPSLDGKRVSLSSLRGKVVVLNFWATWCSPCKRELPHLQEFYDRLKRDPGVAVVAVTIDENRAPVEPFIKENKYTFTVLFDEGLRSKYEVQGVPVTYIIDPSGIIRFRMIGFKTTDPFVPQLEKLVEQYRSRQKGE